MTCYKLLSAVYTHFIKNAGDRLLSPVYCGTNYCLSWCLLCGAGELCSLEDKQSPPFALMLSRHDAWSFGDIFAHYEIPFFFFLASPAAQMDCGLQISLPLAENPK